MSTYIATVPVLPMFTFRRAVVLSVLVTVLSIYFGALFNPPDNGGQNCQSDPAQIARSVTSSDMQLCMPETILSGEYPVTPPGSSSSGIVRP